MIITGGTQAVGIILSIFRMKAVALMLGPPGLGVLSIYTTLQSTAATLGGLGLSSSGVRQIAQAKSDEVKVGQVRTVLVVAHLLQGSLAMITLWLFRRPIAIWLFGNDNYATEVGLVGVAVLLTLLANSQTAVLRGMRRVGDLGRVTVLGALAGTLGGVAGVWLFGTPGLILFVLLQPLAAALIGSVYSGGLDRRRYLKRITEIWQIWKPMVQIGFAFMSATLLDQTVQLLIRSRITDLLGLAAVGNYAAASSLSFTYIGFLLTAISMDYYPRLAEIIHDREAAEQLINDQVQLALAIGGPLLLLLIGLAPLVIYILYSSAFGEAVRLLQWQSAANVLTFTCWPIGLIFVAAARSRVYLLVQINFHLLLLTLIWFGLPHFGLEFAGLAFLTTYVVHFALLTFLAHRVMHFRWKALTLRLIVAHVGLVALVISVALTAPLLGAAVAVLLFLVTGFAGGKLVLEKIGPSARTAPLARLYAACGWPVHTQS